MKNITRSNYRIEITPDTKWWSSRSEVEVCSEMIPQIERHIDNVGNVRIIYDVYETCSYCHRPWNGKQDCCDEAIAEYNRNL